MTTANKTSNSVLTEDTIKKLEELLGSATLGGWWNESEVIHCDIHKNDYPHVCSISGNNNREYSDADLICGLQNNAKELLRLARIGIEIEQERARADKLDEWFRIKHGLSDPWPPEHHTWTDKDRKP